MDEDENPKPSRRQVNSALQFCNENIRAQILICLIAGIISMIAIYFAIQAFMADDTETQFWAGLIFAFSFWRCVGAWLRHRSELERLATLKGMK